jgi:NDP-sugar pyrophosphorylase family protein
MAFFGDGKKYNVNINYVKEDKPLGTAGPLKLMADSFEEDEYFILVNGDIYTELDFSQMVEFAKNKKADIVVGCIEKKEKSKYGELLLNDSNIVGIIEKPERTFLINSGIYVLNSNMLKDIPNDTFFTMVDVINLYLEQGKEVSSYMIEEYWLGIEDVDGMNQVTDKLNKDNDDKQGTK